MKNSKCHEGVASSDYLLFYAVFDLIQVSVLQAPQEFAHFSVGGERAN